MTQDKKFDLIVIGAGPGGYEAAIMAAQRGMKVAIVEKEHFGGTCLNYGCIPTKTLLHGAKMYRDISQGETFGIVVKDISYDVDKMWSRKDKVVEQLQKDILGLMHKYKITVFEGSGCISDAHTVNVEGEETCSINGTYILIATGSKASIPTIKGNNLPGVVVSDKMLEKPEKMPRKMIIVGGGVIGMEFASIFSAFGTQVTVIEEKERILLSFDKEIAQNLKMILKKRGVDIYTSSKVIEFKKNEDAQLSCIYEKEGELHEVEGEVILLATGRKANTQGLTSNELNLTMHQGSLLVNHHFQTNYENIYAIGDVVGGVQLAHVATAEGKTAVLHMLKEPLDMDLNTVPLCVYTDPEIASVGLTIEEANQLEIPIVTHKYLMSGNGKSIVTNEERGFIKIMEHADTGIVLGAQMMCARATDIISEFAMAISMKMTRKSLASIIRPHPTYSESVGEITKRT